MSAMGAKYFFITGLPRTRTGWCANLFTWSSSFCYHDGLRDCSDIRDFVTKMTVVADQVAKAQPQQPIFVGNSDSGLLMVWEAVMKLFPDARWLVNVRPAMEAAQNYFRYFKEHPYQGMTPPSRQEVIDLFEHLNERQTRLITALRADQLRMIETRNWDHLEFARPAWEHIFSGAIPFPGVRWSLLNDLRVNPMSEKIPMNAAQIQDLITSTNEYAKSVR